MTAYCNGHLVERHLSRGRRWWTVDEFERHFDNMDDAARFARSLAPLALPAIRF